MRLLCGFATPCPPLLVKLATGEELQSQSQITLQLDFGGQLGESEGKLGHRDVTCWVLPGLKHDLVLGMQFLSVHNPSVDFVARTMTFADG